ncbi:NAD(P)-dependent dehydrogenase (short-subunit alcohol dehydrogenase family) [Roseivirga ehrenbergii]|uniref:Short-chain dehydrogenase n=1 Tax=Roseivirga ehrenbergii (strain DSM 102268 / JCM 13514 / KCTC 12282 / NCIMB 14502 / KMM 6017) TaxID=279360 RepID=A0A150XC50_ROSEK|nr:SDR family oxidoreductase [Roseivirga ehrenbergii]KYG76252.1 short-chain dehydrogenase [Roseivirga ehrenbergii]TCL00220.1 NAD(P)-dependent dehydrogenase (short-subunit alcohol dehydrogenase family) [Roseivirga ehrenbergii]
MNKGKIIIVTGGSGLIGREIMKTLSSQGFKAINFDIADTDELDEPFVKCNITQPKAVNQALKKVETLYGPVYGLVNNAYPRTKDWGLPFEEIPYDSWSQNVDMQLNAVFYITQQVIKGMVERKEGRIVNISSIYGVVGNDFTIYENTQLSPPAAYSAIKGGLVNFSRYLASKFGKKGISVNCVSPGGIFDHQPEAFVEAYEHKVPMKRMGNPGDISPAVAFFMSEGAGYITGQNLVVDGGWTCI